MASTTPIERPYVPAYADVAQAAFALVRQFPGGAAALAPVVNKTATTLSHEVSPNYPSAKLGLEDAVALSVWSQDWRIANAFVGQMGGMVIPLPKVCAGETSLAALSELARDFSGLVEQVTGAIADGRVTRNELDRVQTQAAELVASVQATVQRVAEIGDEHALERAL
jgi:hypothetical protein